MATTLDESASFGRVQLGAAVVLVVATLITSSTTVDAIHSFIPDVSAMIAVFAMFWIIPSRYRTVGMAVLVGAITLNYLVGLAVLPIFSRQFPNLPSVLASARLAGLVEPITTKALPAMAIIWYYRDKSPELVRRIRSRAWLSGATLGWTFGVMEMLLKVPTQSSTYVSATVVTPQLAIASVLHLVTGTLAAGAIFRWWDGGADASCRQEALTGIAWGVLLLAAMGIHYWWNAGGLIYVYRALGLA